jgi:PIN domain nuclease of toxin-antitoxin system
MIVLDTVTLIYWTVRPERLSAAAALEIERSESLAISSISIWELAVKSRRGHIDLTIPLKDYLWGLEQIPHLQIRSVDAATWLRSAELNWSHRDPADRVIVAMAMLLDCPLITPDRVIGDYYAATVW